MSTSSSPRRVVLTGSSGLIGTALINRLTSGGHTVTRMVRRNPGPGDAVWNPTTGVIDTSALEGADAVVHLAGEGIADSKWTAEHKRAVLDSRVQGTTLLARTMGKLDAKPPVWVSGSAIGFYGNRGDEELTESSPRGAGFLADVVQAWEDATTDAESAGIRVAHIRTGIVMSTKGGALKQQLLPFKLGVGGRMGSGKQWLPWITLDDEVSAIMHVIDTESLSGPVNLVSPHPVTNAEFTKVLGKALKRPTFIPIPLLPLKLLFGEEMVKEMLLASARVLPTKLESSGFVFANADLAAGLGSLLSSHG